ncbi:hypothetical protein Hanom_Chr13g01211111 [Helianthus anomalus]
MGSINQIKTIPKIIIHPIKPNQNVTTLHLIVPELKQINKKIATLARKSSK